MTLKNAFHMTVILFLGFMVSSCSEDTPKATPKPSNISAAEMQAGLNLISDNCSGCHMASEDGTFSRISHIRKTPEGWDMNIARMMIFHGLEIEPQDRRALVKFLSDTQGLAPDETLAHRDILERKHNVIEQDVDPDLAAMCARCHTYARVGLQRRDEEEWQNLVHMHLGQWASIEYQMLSRERDWRADALGPVAEKLGQMYPLKTAEWDDWQNTQWQDMSGDWRITGHYPGHGDASGYMTVKAVGNDKYEMFLALHFADDQSVQGNGKSIVHSGFEWRGAVTLGDQKYRQIWAASKDGNSMTGRMFKRDHFEDGIEITAMREGTGEQAVMSILPTSVKVGVATDMVIHGVNLGRDVSIAGAKVALRSLSDDLINLTVTPDGSLMGPMEVMVGKQSSGQTVAIYNQVDYLKVTPEYGISRVGGGGGPIPKVMAQFEAVGYANGPDGKEGTEDDVRLGIVPVTWSVDNFSEAAAAMQDAKYAGYITEQGTFIPEVAGPNPDRKYGTNNAGDLKVIATYQQGDKKLTAEAHLIATVQRWNNPPIM